MTIQRHYNLPNCTLVLEGLADPSVTTQIQAEVRPVMSLLINAECHLPGQSQPLVGGREFFESLVTAVSLYAQECLSGVHLPRHIYRDRPSFVQLDRLDSNHHRLSVEPDAANAMTGKHTIDLNTVQLFDLIEAVDQFVADTQTLPFWSLNLSPVSRRYAKSDEPIAKQLVPATIGFSGLALATLACFSLGTQTVKKPNCLTPESATCSKPLPDNAANSSSPTLAASPTASPTASPSAPAAATPDTTPSPTASSTPNWSQPDLDQSAALLSTAPAISDAQKLDGLKKKLKEQIQEKWKTPPTFTEDLSYRVGVAEDGAIVGYKPDGSAALENARQTPLLDLLYTPMPGKALKNQALAQFKVTLTPQQQVKIAPWEASKPLTTAKTDQPQSTVSLANGASPDSTGSPSVAGSILTEVTDRTVLLNLGSKLYDQIDQRWKNSSPTLDRKPLMYLVRVKPNGAVIDYQPQNDAAIQQSKVTPLAQLAKSTSADPASTTGTTAGTVASFRVVFKPGGTLEVAPWFGMGKK